MPKRPQYDLARVLDDAIAVFVEHGYHGASLNELIGRTGFNRRAFYQHFGDKYAFYLAVLEHYRGAHLTPITRYLYANQGLSSIRRFFTAYIALIAGKGCLLINATCELGVDRKDIRANTRHHLDALQLGFIGCLEKARARDELHPNTGLEALAQQLTVLVQGFAVHGIAAECIEELEMVVDNLLRPVSRS